MEVLTCGLISRALKRSSAQLVTTVQAQQKRIIVAVGTDLFSLSCTFFKEIIFYLNLNEVKWFDLVIVACCSVSSAGTIVDWVPLLKRVSVVNMTLITQSYKPFFNELI